MDKQLANKVIKDIPFNTLETLKEYIHTRKQFIYKMMETAPIEDFTFLQGQIAELKILEKIRDTAVAIKDKNNG